MSDIKYTIVKDEKSCYGPSWSVNGEWLKEGQYLEQNDELIDYLLLKVKEAIKDNTSNVESLLSCIQYDDWEADEGESCETCGHSGGGKTTWKV